MSNKERIGFVGVGLMGHGIAKNIVEAGYPLTVIAHRNREPVEDLIGRGASEAQSFKEVGEASDIVFLCVTGSVQVEAAVLGKDGLIEGLKPGSVVIDCSTADPGSTMKIAAQLDEKGISFADSPLGRTPKEAWTGELDAMVGASDEVFKRIEPVIKTWTRRIVHVGGLGDGHRMKLINNFISLGYAALYAEALTLADKVGISPRQFDSIIRGSRMDCGFYQTFMEYTLDGNENAHKFTLSNGFKDIRYVASMGDSVGLANPMADATKNTLALAVANGGDGSEEYVPFLPRYVAAFNGSDLTPKKKS